MKYETFKYCLHIIFIYYIYYDFWGNINTFLVFTDLNCVFDRHSLMFFPLKLSVDLKTTLMTSLLPGRSSEASQLLSPENKISPGLSSLTPHPQVLLLCQSQSWSFILYELTGERAADTSEWGERERERERERDFLSFSWIPCSFLSESLLYI